MGLAPSLGERTPTQADEVPPTDIQTALSQAETSALQELARGKIVLECGAFWGHSTIAMALTALRIHSVDWHRGDEHAGYVETLSTFVANLRRYGVDNKVVSHVGRFADVLPQFRPNAFDGCFLDGQHDRGSVEQDLGMIRLLVKRGGWIAMHDYGLFDVAPASESFTRTSEFRLERVVDTLAILRSDVPLLRRAAKRLPEPVKRLMRRALKTVAPRMS
jgi:predicted O-methyltransferase YrrM